MKVDSNANCNEIYPSPSFGGWRIEASMRLIRAQKGGQTVLTFSAERMQYCSD